MAYNSSNRSERLLQGRRFTTDELTLAQEAFTDVFDLGAGEIFTDENGNGIEFEFTFGLCIGIRHR